MTHSFDPIFQYHQRSNNRLDRYAKEPAQAQMDFQGLTQLLGHHKQIAKTLIRHRAMTGDKAFCLALLTLFNDKTDRHPVGLPVSESRAGYGSTYF